jgi:DNA-binding PadR family transcriptional regulator
VSKPADLVQGTLDMLILKILALQAVSGWAISQRLKQISSDVLDISDGSLNPALQRARTSRMDSGPVESE